ncbi:MAG TPA: heparinase II/III-family protein, partial [Stellaceae bacterium]|nr:heparinase II/III-family protein [Stellaceae bacterium]
ATAAHSTLVVADTNAVELRPGGLGRRPHHVAAERAEREGAQWLQASHDGYEGIFGLVHQRQLFLAGDGEDLRGEDRLSGRAGQGFAIRFHLHPAVQASLAQDGTTALLRLPGGLGWRLRAQGAVMSLAESVYLGAGERRKSQQVVLDGHVGSAGASVKWALRREGRKAEKGDE